MNILLIVLVSLLSCAGQLCQKQATAVDENPRPRRHLLLWLGLSVLLLGLAMLAWLRVLQEVPVGVAYPMLSLNFVLVALAARWLWHEHLSLRHCCGILLIVGGVAVMGGYT
ncbi:4-amino-4-deoxy-L-arabinose-phosphoundecaprenol flippase subunit ArnE [Pantoea coffeiphila]|uniref:Probable 4-amino-4-deoxy-L-arabinose-phosphoundecaprenol flippase subunit ArnE n=1 Tax=Pantoea coffeiphila TaxID=1465635 RepID=A0A2S9IHY4_9GAMM|nr:4-amino-4-deoxy-L-arabinose-phosphoundecaprenol flippase subunit ArnE [Pantoea coffeiphila]PRD17401.1 4-amino-4-deoxy-L-arabinose-phospho-UDP flippase [Pantoea coffeiphila]